MSGTLRAKYATEVVPALKAQFGYKNAMQVPRLEKIVVNIGLGEALTNSKAVDAAVVAGSVLRARSAGASRRAAIATRR